MAAYARLFWNPDDRRLRVIWRLLLYLLLLAAAWMALVSLLSPFPAGLEMATSQRDPAAGGGIGAALIMAAVAVLGIVLPTLFAARFFDRRPVSDLGLQFTARWRRDLLFGLVLGALLVVLVFLVEYALGWITVEGFYAADAQTPFTQAILLPLVQFSLVGFYEELMARGYLLKNFAEGLSFSPFGPKGGMLLALLLSAAYFGLLHAGNPSASPVSSLYLFLAGLFLGLPVLLTDELAMPVGIHIAWNFFQGSVFGFPVSGTAAGGVSILTVKRSGPELWTGGAFGPEAGLIGLAALAAGALLVLWWVRRTRGSTALALSVADYQPQPDSRPG